MNVVRAMMRSTKAAVHIVSGDDSQPYPLSASPEENIESAITSARDTRGYDYRQVIEEMERLIASWQ